MHTAYVLLRAIYRGKWYGMFVGMCARVLVCVFEYVCVCVSMALYWLSGRDAREDMLVHRIHSCTVYSIRERAFLILGELRHRTAQGAAGSCNQEAQQAAVQSIIVPFYAGKTQTE